MFELIVLDGLLATHERSVILLDDIFPNDVFSCIRDQLEGTMMRQLLTNSPVNAWHGDTYKVMPLIETFHPSLNDCTIIGDGNPKALVCPSTTPLGFEIDIIKEQDSLNMASLNYL